MSNEISFCLAALLTLAGAIAAMSLRNVVHGALCAAGAFAGLAGIYLQLGAEFVGAAQVLVYVGAVAILIMFTVLLTKGGDVRWGVPRASRFWVTGLAVSALVFGCLAASILRSPALDVHTSRGITAPVGKIGAELMTGCVLPLEATGLLLTAALLGAVIIAVNDNPIVQCRSRTGALPREIREEATVP